MVGKKVKHSKVKHRPRASGPLDVHFGEKLRAQRLTMVPKLSQEDLGKAIGVTFQQIQKYERGTNRISAAQLVRVAAVLKVDIQYFFDDLPGDVSNSKEIETPGHIKMSGTPHGPRLIDAFLNLKNDKVRGAIADLAQVLAR
jgi:transcriptional regulator with XRE-family HTH domain